MMVIPHPPKLQLMPSMQLPIKTSVFQTSAGVSMHNTEFSKEGLAQDEEKMRKWLIMVLVVMKQVFLPQKCHPSESSVALITHRIISSGKVVIYRISLVITGCQKRRLDESSQRRTLVYKVPVILHALYEMAHNLRGSRDQFFFR